MTKMSDGNDSVTALIHESAAKCLEIWLGPSNHDAASRRRLLHSDCRAVMIDQQGTFHAWNGDDFDISPLVDMTVNDHVSFFIKSVDLVQAGNDCTAAAVHATVHNVSGWLVFLEESPAMWTCISAAFSPNQESVHEPSSEEVSKLRSCAWDGYLLSNRVCDGQAMAPNLHPDFRLTFVNQSHESGKEASSQVMIIPRSEFLQMVTSRYQRLPHADYIHLRDDPRVAQHDEWISVSFATPNVAMVKLKVGHPPFLWTDLLTCIRVHGEEWIIVHKSSCSEPLLANEKDASPSR